MPGDLTKTAIVGVVSCAVLVVCGLTLWVLISSGSAGSQLPPAALSSHTAIKEGPGGRVQLTHWIRRKDPENRGLKLHYYTGAFSGEVVSVPNDVNPLPVTGQAGEINYEGSVAWYRTTLEISRAGLYALEFESANFLATVWIDGHELGSHEGTYLPFEFRRELGPGSHTLVVRVDWRSPAAQSRAGFHRTWFNFGGINGEVNIRAIGASELANPTIQTHLQPDTPTAKWATVELGVEVRNNGPSRTIEPVGVLVRGSRRIPVRFRAHRIAHSQTLDMSASVRIEHPALWSPAHPNLYALTIAVSDQSSYSARVGLRELTWGHERMYLNGRRLILHGASIQEDARGHGDALTPSDQRTLITELKAIGANATRSQHPLDPGLLEKLDAAGILVWQGVGPVDPAGDWSARTPALMRKAKQRVRTTVIQDQLHPSIIAWNLANEIAGNGHPGGQAQYVQSMAQWLHSYDPGRMVAVDVWGEHPPTRAGVLYKDVDAVSETEYSGWYNSPLDTSAQLAALIKRRLAKMHKTFAGKVQIISEFGAEANSLNPYNSPGGYGFQSKLLATHISVYEHDPKISGMLVWDLRDFALTPSFAGGSISSLLPQIKLVDGLDQKGLYDYEDHAKPAQAVVARLFKALPEN